MIARACRVLPVSKNRQVPQHRSAFVLTRAVRPRLTWAPAGWATPAAPCQELDGSDHGRQTQQCSRTAAGPLGRRHGQRSDRRLDFGNFDDCTHRHDSPRDARRRIRSLCFECAPDSGGSESTETGFPRSSTDRDVWQHRPAWHSWPGCTARRRTAWKRRSQRR